MITVTGPTPGSLIPPPKLTLPGGEGKTPDLPFSRLPRIDRLKVSGKYDTTEDPASDITDNDEGSEYDNEGSCTVASIGGFSDNRIDTMMKQMHSPIEQAINKIRRSYRGRNHHVSSSLRW